MSVDGLMSIDGLMSSGDFIGSSLLDGMKLIEGNCDDVFIHHKFLSRKVSSQWIRFGSISHQ